MNFSSRHAFEMISAIRRLPGENTAQLAGLLVQGIGRKVRCCLRLVVLPVCIFAISRGSATADELLNLVASGTFVNGDVLSGDVILDSTTGTVVAANLRTSGPDPEVFDNNIFVDGGRVYVSDTQGDDGVIILLTPGSSLIGYSGGPLASEAMPVHGLTSVYLGDSGSLVDLASSGMLTPAPESSTFGLTIGTGFLFIVALLGRETAGQLKSKLLLLKTRNQRAERGGAPSAFHLPGRTVSTDLLITGGCRLRSRSQLFAAISSFRSLGLLILSALLFEGFTMHAAPLLPGPTITYGITYTGSGPNLTASGTGSVTIAFMNEGGQTVSGTLTAFDLSLFFMQTISPFATSMFSFGLGDLTSDAIVTDGSAGNPVLEYLLLNSADQAAQFTLAYGKDVSSNTYPNPYSTGGSVSLAPEPSTAELTIGAGLLTWASGLLRRKRIKPIDLKKRNVSGISRPRILTKATSLVSLFLAVIPAAATTFSYTGVTETFTVPTSGVYEIIAYGAGGGFAIPEGHNPMFPAFAGGGGAEIGAEFNLAAGDSLDISVGGGGYLGPYAGSGGGGSFVVLNGTTLLVVAGGGGGASIDGSGGDGLLTTGGNGRGGSAGGAQGGGGGGSFFRDGGSAPDGGGGGGRGYPLLTGGAKGAEYGDWVGGYGGGGGNGYGGGGGGGYTGGNGGDAYGPGAGGGSYVNALALAQFLMTNVNRTDGQVQIVQLTPEPGSFASFCFGLMLTMFGLCSRRRSRRTAH